MPATAPTASVDVDLERGFLPSEDPLVRFDDGADEFLHELDDLGHRIPDLIETDDLRPRIENLDAPDASLFDDLTRRELLRVYSVTGFLASAYVHQIDAPPRDTIPAGVAVPLYESTDRLDRLPILSYDGYALHNWTRVEDDGPISPHNVETITNFVSMLDEQWFIVIHVVIEAKAAPAVAAIPDLQQGVLEGDERRVRDALRRIEDGLHDVVSTLDRMPEHNSPENYGPSFRPYIEQFRNVEYEGVPELDGPQSFRGETGAQSSLFPAFDGALSIDHGDNPLVHHVEDMRAYMPPEHREFIAAAEDGPAVREFVVDADDPDLRETYDTCLDHMIRFREIHAEYAQEYIMDRIGDDEGTGGTPYGPFLDNLIEDTRERKIEG